MTSRRLDRQQDTGVSEADAPFDGQADAAAVARVRAGDREAFRTLVMRYEDVLYRHAERMVGSPDTAADLVQAAFVKAYTQLGRCREPSRFGAWVYRILSNGCKDYLKSRRRKDVSLDASEVVANRVRSSDAPDEDYEQAELRAVLQGALETLDEAQREAFVMKHVEGRSYEEMAELLDVSVPALKMRVHRAREMLKATLKEVL